MAKSGPKRRLFSKAIMEQVWNEAKSVPNRDPKLWKYDAIGNVITKELNSNRAGALAY